MHKTLRKVLFTFFVFIFVGLGVLLITQTQGLVIDWKNLKFVKTGGIYIRSFPTDAEILINGKPEKRSVSFFNTGTLIKDLFPKTYEITIQEKDRIIWKKKLEVSPGMVASANAVRLFEKNPELKPLSTRFVNNFWTTNAGIVEKVGDKLYLNEMMLHGTNVILAESDQNNIVTSDNKGNLFFVDLTNPKSVVNIKEMFDSQIKMKKGVVGSKISEIFLHPFSPGILIIQSDKTIYLLDTKRIGLEKIMQSTSTAIFTKTKNELFLFGNSRVITYNLIFAKNSVFVTPIETPKKVVATRNGDIFFITDEKNTVTFFNRGNSSSSIIGTHIIDSSLSPDESKFLLAHENGSFSIFYLEEDTGDVKIPQYNIRIIPGKYDFSQGIKNLLWFPNYPGYFGFLENNTLILAETDTRTPNNNYHLFLKIKKADTAGKFRILSEDGALSLVNFKF